MYEYELMSYTVHQAIYFSDGKSESGTFILPGHRIGICNDCKMPFWKEDAVSELDPHDEKYADIPEVKDLFDLNSMLHEQFHVEKVKFFQKLIDDGFANTRERHVYMRFQLWWSINDLHRNVIRFSQLFALKSLSYSRIKHLLINRRSSLIDFNSFDEAFNINLDKLAILLEKEEEKDYLTLAEIYRELGKFRNARKVLQKCNEKKSKAFHKIRSAIYFRKTRVFKIS